MFEVARYDSPVSGSLHSLINDARRQAARRRILQAVVVGSATCVVVTLALTPLVGFPRSGLAVLAIPIAVCVARCSTAPSRVALARQLDDHFATGDLLATALGVDDHDPIGRAIVAQAGALAARLASADLAFDREAMRRRLAIAAVAVAAALTLSAVLSSPARTRSAERRSSVADAEPTDAERAVADRSSEAPDRAGRPEEAASADASQVNAASDATVRDAGRVEADGTGAARTNATIAAPPARRGADAMPPSDGAPTTGDGDGVAAAGATVAANGTARRVALDVSAPTIAASPATIARDAIAAGRVPAASRALVRAFFDAGDSTR